LRQKARLGWRRPADGAEEADTAHRGDQSTIEVGMKFKLGG
jgi:hypothetical protein